MSPEDRYSEHGLTADEYGLLEERLGREPNRVELGIAGAMWSEHCSYKSSRIWLRRLPTEGPSVVQGPGENAGIVRLDGEWCIAFKVESHNHPSFIEPYHGAATGVGGILRDVFTMGARPVANLNSLRFGAPDHERTAYLLDGVVRGIGDYGNCVGVPTVAGETYFAPCYNGNILVNAMTCGVVKEDGIFLASASGVGNPVFYVGSATGMDGIHGATMASASFDDEAAQQRPAVQVGDPFTEKLLLEACLELMASGAVVGIQDMGAAGLTSSSFEMAQRGEVGLDLYLDQVPVRQAGMGPYELMLSESQERMLVVLEKGKEAVAHEIFDKWDLQVAQIGQVTDTREVRCLWHGEVAARLPVDLMVEEAPIYERPVKPDPKRAELAQMAAEPQREIAPEEALHTLFRYAGMAEKLWITDQYDSTVQGNTVREPGGDAGVVWVPEARRGFATCVEGNSRLVYLHPRHGAMHLVAEGVRNLACVGAVPLGATDCLNFGNPERPEIMWEFSEAIEGMADALREMETPIVSGNVSFYNETLDESIWPTPVLGFVGRVECDPEQVPLSHFSAEDLVVFTLGWPATTLAGSAYLDLVDGRVCGELPAPDFAALRRLCDLVRGCIADNLVAAAHDAAEGGLLAALVEMAMVEGIGLRTSVAVEETSVQRWFGEDGQLIVVAAPPADAQRILERAQAADVPAAELGTTGGDAVALQGLCNIDLATLRHTWRNVVPQLVREQPIGGE